MTLADELGVEFVYVPQFNIMLADQFTPEKLGSMPLMLHTFSPLTKVLNRILKRLLDLSIAVPFVIISPIIFIPIAIAVKCSSRARQLSAISCVGRRSMSCHSSTMSCSAICR